MNSPSIYDQLKDNEHYNYKLKLIHEIEWLSNFVESRRAEISYDTFIQIQKKLSSAKEIVQSASIV